MKSIGKNEFTIIVDGYECRRIADSLNKLLCINTKGVKQAMAAYPDLTALHSEIEQLARSFEDNTF